MDIPINEGIFQNTQGKNPGEFAQQIKRACRNQFGVAGPVFIERLIARFNTFSEKRSTVSNHYQSAKNALVFQSLEPEHARALQKLALVEVAGSLASDLGILPLSAGEINESIQFIRKAWLSETDAIAEAQKGLLALREYILRYHGLFVDANSPENDSPIREIAGYIDRRESLYLFTRDMLVKACGGANIRLVCEELEKEGFLSTNEGGRHTAKHLIRMLDQRPRVYRVKKSFLEGNV